MGLARRFPHTALVSLAALCVGLGCSEERPATAEPQDAPWTIALVNVEADASGHSAKVTVETTPRAWIKLLDPQTGAELRAEVDAARGNADADGRFTFVLRRPVVGNNKVVVVAHDARIEKVRQTLDIPYEAPAPPVSLKLTTTTSPDDGAPLTDCSATLLHKDQPASVHCTARATDDATLPLAVEGPAGATVTLGGTSTTLGSDGKGKLVADLHAALATLELGKLRGPGTRSVELTLSLETAAGARFDGQLRLGRAVVTRRLEAIATRPLTFGASDTAPGAPETTLYFPAGGGEVEALGKRTRTLADVDVVAIGHDRSKVLETCKYRSSRGDREKVLERRRGDLEVIVHDRRTGKKLASKHFQADPPRSCTEAFAGGGVHPTTSVGWPTVKAWLQAR